MSGSNANKGLTTPELKNIEEINNHVKNIIIEWLTIPTKLLSPPGVKPTQPPETDDGISSLTPDASTSTIDSDGEIL
jgi:hypothetical protein